jgi:hypothetical protein
MALSHNQVECASWLINQGFCFKEGEADAMFKDVVLENLQVTVVGRFPGDY